MAEKNKKPAIRFKEFSDDWEQRELGVLLVITSASRVHKNEWTESGVPFFRSSDVVADYKGLENNKAFISFELYEELSNKSGCVQKDDLLVTGGGSIGIPYLVKSNEPLYFKDADLLWLKNSDKLNGYFLYSFFSTLIFRGYVNSITHIGTISHYTIEQAKSTPINVPEKKEQDKIGEYLTNLDHLITLNQHKYNKLVSIKKAMLEKMFPKEGTDVPEIRFKGFTVVWEEHILGDYANFRRGSFPQPYGNKEWYDGDGAMPFVQVVDVRNNLTLVDDTKQKISIIAQSKSVLVEKGKVIVTLQGSIGRVAIVQYDAYVDRTLLIFEDYKNKTDIDFWAYLIQQKFDIEKKKAPGGTIKTITKEALSIFQMVLPEYEEQLRIGTFFKNLDNLITLQKRELEKLKNIKKACLEKMFV